MIENIQALRGLAAILIFYHHYGFDYGFITGFGDLGVVFFMMLSGFVLYYSFNVKYDDISSAPSLKIFISARLHKIYPPYIVCWALAILFLPYSGAFIGKILSIFLLQSWIPEPAIYFAGNPVSWFISDLLLCYVIFIPYYKLSIRNKHLFHILTSLYLAFYCTIVFITPSDLVHGIIYINPMMQISNFILGIMLAKYFIRAKSYPSNIAAAFLQLLAVVLIIAFLFFYDDIPSRFAFGSYWWIAVVPTIGIFAMTDKIHTAITRLLHSFALQKLGALSFYLYLIHYICISLWHRVLNYVGLSTENLTLQIVQSVVLLGITIFLSVIFNSFITGLRSYLPSPKQ